MKAIILHFVILFSIVFLFGLNSFAQSITNISSSSKSSSNVLQPKNNCVEVSSDLNDEYIRLTNISKKYIEGVKIFDVQAMDLIKILNGAGTNTELLSEKIRDLEETFSSFENLNSAHLISLNNLSNQVCLLDKAEYNQRFKALVSERAELLEIGINLENMIKNDIKFELIKIRGQYSLN